MTQSQNLPVIVIPRTPSPVEAFAARELSRYLGLLYSASAPSILSEPEAEGVENRFMISVGQTSAAAKIFEEAQKLKEDGYVLREIDGCLFIVGQNARGSLYGTYGFLEDFLGIRWPEPGTEAEVIPKIDRFDPTGLDCTEEPSLPHRTLRVWHPYESESGLREYIDWQAKQRMNYLYWHGGSDDYELQDDVLAPFHDSDGEFLRFVKQRGFIIDNSSHSFKRFFKETPVDISSRETEDHIVGVLCDYLDRHPFLDYLRLWSSDGWGGGVLGTEESAPLDYPDNRAITSEMDFRVDPGTTMPSITNTFVDFLNRVEERVRERHPKIHLTMIAYNKTLLAPTRVKNAEGQQVCTAFRRSYSHGFGDSESAWNTPQRAEFECWLESCNHVVMYEYYLTGNLGSFGRPNPHIIAEDLKYLASVGAAGTGSQSRSDLFRNLGPNYYTYAKCSWNVDRVVDQVLEDYYEATYGAVAAPKVKEMFDRWESIWNSGGDYFRYDWEKIQPLFTDEVCVELQALCKEAIQLVESQKDKENDNTIYLKRCHELSIVLDGVQLLVQFARTGDESVSRRIEELNKHSFIFLWTKRIKRARELHIKGY